MVYNPKLTNVMSGMSNYRGPQPNSQPGMTTAQRFAGAGYTLPGGIPAGTPAATGYMKSRLMPTNLSTQDTAAIEANRNYWLMRNSGNPNYNGPPVSTLTGPAYNAAARTPTSGILTSGGRPLGGGMDNPVGGGYVPPPAPIPQFAPAPAPATSGIQWTPEDMERELLRIRSEGITWNSGNRLPYMQTMFDRLRASGLQNRLQPRGNPVTRF